MSATEGFEAGAEAAELFAALHAACFDAPWSEADFARLLASSGVKGLISRSGEIPQGLSLIRTVAGGMRAIDHRCSARGAPVGRRGVLAGAKRGGGEPFGRPGDCFWKCRSAIRLRAPYMRGQAIVRSACASDIIATGPPHGFWRAIWSDIEVARHMDTPRRGWLSRTGRGARPTG
jgi:hypothetical protein